MDTDGGNRENAERDGSTPSPFYSIGKELSYRIKNTIMRTRTKRNYCLPAVFARGVYFSYGCAHLLEYPLHEEHIQSRSSADR